MNKILTIFALVVLLTGCASYYTELKHECQSSKVLYADLTKDAFNRIYITPNGKHCTEIMQ